MNKEIEISPRQIAKAITDLLNEKEQLEQENKELHNKIDKAIDFIDIYTNGINLEAFDCLKLMYRIKKILKEGDKNE